jgi:gliding motility-associated-like protein
MQMKAFLAKILSLFSLFTLNCIQADAQILQNDTTICRGTSLLLSVDTTQVSGTACLSNALPSNLQNGLVAYYPFCGNANDATGNGNNGTVFGATLTTDRFGLANRAYSFVQGNHIKGSANNFPTGERTISLWFYATNIGVSNSGPTPIGYGGGVCGTSWFQTIDNFFTPNSQQNTYQVQGHCNSESVLYPYGPVHPNNAWHHWVITTANTGTRFYIDGVMVLSDTTFINQTNVLGKDFILGGPVGVNGLGFYADGNIYGLVGKLDDVFIYNRALTPAEVLLQYQSQSVSWSTGATTPSITVSPVQTTKYYVTVTNSTSTYSDSVLVTVSIPDTSLTVLDPVSSCANNDSVRLKAGIANTYTWLRNGIPVAGATARDFTAFQTGTYRVVVINSQGCTDTSRSVDIALNPRPLAAFTINTTPQCLNGNSFVFTNRSTISSGTLTYNWNFDDGTFATTTDANHVYTTPGNFTVYLVVTSNNGCKDSISRNLTVTQSLITAVTIAATSATICTGTPVTFTATPTNGGTAPSYQWQVNGTNVGTNSATYTTAGLGNGNMVSVIMTSNATCASPVAPISNAVTMSVTPSFTPSVNITVPSTTICVGRNVVFTATSTNGGTNLTYQWKLNGSNVGTNSPTFMSNTLANGDMINCLITTNAFCAFPNTVSSNNITVTINAVCPIGFFMPNAFTPNKDGKNDVLKPMLFGNVISYKFSVYNRWGQKVYETNDLQKGWDGKTSGFDTNANVFIWVCTYQFEGQTIENKKGTVVLIQ